MLQHVHLAGLQSHDIQVYIHSKTVTQTLRTSLSLFSIRSAGLQSGVTIYTTPSRGVETRRYKSSNVPKHVDLAGLQSGDIQNDSRSRTACRAVHTYQRGEAHPPNRLQPLPSA